MPRSLRHALLLIVAPALLHCGGGSTANRDSLLARLRQAANEPVDSATTRSAHNEAVRRAVDEGAFDGMSRSEVMQILGRGSPCSARPTCAERGYESDDWAFDIGRDPQTGVARIPMLLLGFDVSGRVARASYVTVD